MKLNGEVRKEFDHYIFSLKNRHPEWYSVSRAVKNLKAKVLWVHDEEDRITPWRDAKRVKEEGLQNIEFLVTKGLGHRGIYKDAKISKTIIDFL